MGFASVAYGAAPQRWDEAGRQEPTDVNGEGVMKLSCWINSPGAKHDGVSDRLRTYLAAHQRILEGRTPNWLDDLFADNEYCSHCGQSWRIENCSLCTYCSATYPPCCGEKRQFKLLKNGNRECNSCHQGEIVG